MWKKDIKHVDQNLTYQDGRRKLSKALTGKQEPDSRLDLPGDDGAPLVVVGKPVGLNGHSLQQVIDE